MDKFQTARDFGADSAIMAILKPIVLAVPDFFPIYLFLSFVFLAGASYFMILKTSGRKRFWQSITGISFVMFIASLIVASMNEPDITFLSGYWVGFYILMVLGSWYGLRQYK